jgi:hypothetical protein
MAQFKKKSDNTIIEATQWWPGTELPGVVAKPTGVTSVCTQAGELIELTPGDYLQDEGTGVNYQVISNKDMLYDYTRL